MSQTPIETGMPTGAESPVPAPVKRDAKLRLAVQRIPQPVWSLFVAGAQGTLLGVLGKAAGQPWLLPTIGPTIYLQAVQPEHPSGRVYNTIAGNAIAVLVSLLVLTLTGAYASPDMIATGVVTWTRVAAGILSLALTMLASSVFRANHPAAGATALLVALGPMQQMHHAINIIIAVAIVAVIGVALRRMRTGGKRPS